MSAAGHHFVAEDLAPLFKALVGRSAVEACSSRRVVSWKRSMAPRSPQGRGSHYPTRYVIVGIYCSRLSY